MNKYQSYQTLSRALATAGPRGMAAGYPNGSDDYHASVSATRSLMASAGIPEHAVQARHGASSPVLASARLPKAKPSRPRRSLAISPSTEARHAAPPAPKGAALNAALAKIDSPALSLLVRNRPQAWQDALAKSLEDEPVVVEPKLRLRNAEEEEPDDGGPTEEEEEEEKRERTRRQFKRMFPAKTPAEIELLVEEFPKGLAR
jgi:hypothetical protein